MRLPQTSIARDCIYRDPTRVCVYPPGPLLDIHPMTPNSPITVAVVVSEKKWRVLSTRGVFMFRPQSPFPVRYVFVNSGSELTAVQPDVILSKISDRPDVQRTMLRMGDGAQVASVDAQRVATDRWLIADRIMRCGCGVVHVPHSIRLEGPGDADRTEPFFHQHGKGIVKPRQACGPADSHHMQIVTTRDEVREFIAQAGPAVLQAFIPHDSDFIKVFVIGTRVFAFRRSSVDGKTTGVFSSQDIGKSIGGPFPVDDPALLRCIEVITAKCAELFEFSLFGIDLVQDQRDGRLYVVDLNFFPSFSELGDSFGPLLDEYCHKMVQPHSLAI